MEGHRGRGCGDGRRGDPEALVGRRSVSDGGGTESEGRVGRNRQGVQRCRDTHGVSGETGESGSGAPRVSGGHTEG